MVYLPTEDPAGLLTRLKPIEGDTFRRIRDDDELGEPITFLRDDSGRVVSYRQFENVNLRVR